MKDNNLIKKDLKASLIYNDPSTGENIKVLNEIIKNINDCNSFSFSVAFISDQGLRLLHPYLHDLELRGAHGRIITSTYLDFNKPEIFEKLLEYKNIEIRIYKDEGFHPKGYIFENVNETKIIIGSSNITDKALVFNQEWNLCISSFLNESVVKRVENEFEAQWDKSVPLTKEWIEDYKRSYTPPVNDLRKSNEEKFDYNEMQRNALLALDSLRHEGERKALLISATGTGKTFLSAFDVKQSKAKRMLYIVHRENIAKKAMETFHSVMPNKTSSFFTDSELDYKNDFVFATIQKIGKREYFEKFSRDHFDYIIFDEVHHLGAQSYQGIFNYFMPSLFTLGMTATPDRMDEYDIYKDFNYKIACEIYLQQAMEYDLLCPFHYYGISDLVYDGNEINKEVDVNVLTCEARVDHIIEASKKYSFSGNKVHGLIFVSRIEEAKAISSMMNTRGYRTIPIVQGVDIEEAIKLLESEDNTNYCDYLICVDKFNEGIDIPCVNQIIMLRETESATVFIQQLGRGLRKNSNKDYTVVIDIIGNYDNNFFIPVALSGKRTYSKSDLDGFMMTGKQFLPGSSTIYFDQISKERIYKSIDNISSIRNKYKILIDNAYQLLEKRLGRRPYLEDFYLSHEIDPLLIIQRYGSYYNYLLKSKITDELFDDTGRKILKYLSKKILNGKRNFELLILKELLKNGAETKENISKSIKCDDDEFRSSIKILNGKFEKNEEMNKLALGYTILDVDNNNIRITDDFAARLDNEEFKRQIEDIIETGLLYYEDNYKESGSDYPFVIGKKYTRFDVSRLLNYEKDESSTMFGMKQSGDEAEIFVTYNKENPKDDRNYIQGKPNYSDIFIDEEVFEWESRMRTKIEGNYMQKVINSKKKRLFIQKFDKDEHYYVGLVEIIKAEEIEKNDNNNNPQIVTKVEFLLNNPIDKELLDYFNNYDKTNS